MGVLVAAVRKALEDDGWPVWDTDEPDVIASAYQGENTLIVCVAQCGDDDRFLVFYSFCPLEVPPQRRMAVAEFLMRANHQMRLGNFEMDFEDGEVRFKTSLDTDGADLTPAMVRNLIAPNVLAMDRYVPGIALVLNEEETPGEAVRLVEEGRIDEEATN